MNNQSPDHTRRPRKTVIWTIAAILIVIALIVAAQGVIGGLSDDGPGDDNANPDRSEIGEGRQASP
jgi:hypothetical protein